VFYVDKNPLEETFYIRLLLSLVISRKIGNSMAKQIILHYEERISTAHKSQENSS